MPRQNTAQTYGTVARVFHWLTALIILTAIPLGVIANDLPFDTAGALAFKAQLFSLHKTLGVAAFFVGLASHPLGLHPNAPCPPAPRAQV